MAKRLLGLLLSTIVSRAITRIVITVGWHLARIASFARARLLFPGSPDVVCHWSTEVKCPENITLGKRVVIGTRCTIGAAAPIYFGDDVLLSKGVFVETATVYTTTPPRFARMAKPIRIENGVWLGAYSMVLAGVTIGENSIIGAGVIVRKSVPAGSFVVDERPRMSQRRWQGRG